MKRIVIGLAAALLVPLCGYAKPTTGIFASGTNSTGISPAYLPHICRER